MKRMLLFCTLSFVFGALVSAVFVLELSRQYSGIKATENDLRMSEQIVNRGAIAAWKGDWVTTQTLFEIGNDVRNGEISCKQWSALFEPIGYWGLVPKRHIGQEDKIRAFNLAVIGVALEKQGKNSEAAQIYEKLHFEQNISREKVREMAKIVLDTRRELQ